MVQLSGEAYAGCYLLQRARTHHAAMPVDVGAMESIAGMARSYDSLLRRKRRKGIRHHSTQRESDRSAPAQTRSSTPVTPDVLAQCAQQ
jgi:hypothetical protein